MGRYLADLGTLVIATSGTASTAISAFLDDAKTLTIAAPSALTGTVTVQISVDGGTTYVDAGSGGSDITIGAGNAVTITDPSFNAVRVNSGSAEAATRTFTVKKSIEV